MSSQGRGRIKAGVEWRQGSNRGTGGIKAGVESRQGSNQGRGRMEAGVVSRHGSNQGDIFGCVSYKIKRPNLNQFEPI
jgi:hypothetical protein